MTYNLAVRWGGCHPEEIFDCILWNANKHKLDIQVKHEWIFVFSSVQ